jgi:hypothetical protein
MLERIKTCASIIRDVGIIIGIVPLIYVGMSLYDIQYKAFEQQIKAPEAQNNVLKETQFGRAFALIEGQKKLYETEKDVLEKKIASMLKAGKAGEERISILQAQLFSLNAQITTRYKALQGLSETYFSISGRVDPEWLIEPKSAIQQV